MRYIGALIMAAVFLLGVVFLYAAARQSVLQIERGPHLKRTRGEIIKIEIEQRDGRRRISSQPRPYQIAVPIISFQTESGETIVFKGQITERGSDSGGGFKVGEKMDVIYDPENKLNPVVDSPYIAWGAAISAIFGFVLTGAGLLFFKFFWLDKVRFRRINNPTFS